MEEIKNLPKEMVGISLMHQEVLVFLPFIPWPSREGTHFLVKMPAESATVKASTGDGYVLSDTLTPNVYCIWHASKGTTIPFSGPMTETAAIFYYNGSFALAFVSEIANQSGLFTIKCFYGDTSSWSEEVNLFLERGTHIVPTSVLCFGNTACWRTEGKRPGIISFNVVSRHYVVSRRPTKDGTWQLGVMGDRLCAVVVSEDKVVCFYLNELLNKWEKEGNSVKFQISTEPREFLGGCTISCKIPPEPVKFLSRSEIWVRVDNRFISIKMPGRLSKPVFKALTFDFPLPDDISNAIPHLTLLPELMDE